MVIIGILLSFWLCYMEWGNGQSAFLAEAAYQLFFKEKLSLANLVHPLVLTGLAGQIILLYSALAKKPKRIITIVGIVSLSIMVIMVLLAGILSLNPKMILSTLPFTGLSIYFFMRVK